MNTHTICHLCKSFGRPITMPIPRHGDILVYRCSCCGTIWTCNLRSCDVCARLERRFNVTDSIARTPEVMLDIATFLTSQQALAATVTTFDRLVLSGGRMAVRDDEGQDPLAVALGLEGSPSFDILFSVLKRQNRVRKGTKLHDRLYRSLKHALHVFDQAGIMDVGLALGRDRKVA